MVVKGFEKSPNTAKNSEDDMHRLKSSVESPALGFEYHPKATEADLKSPVIITSPLPALAMKLVDIRLDVWPFPCWVVGKENGLIEQVLEI